MALKIREPGSAITHFIAFILALLAAVPLLVKSYTSSTRSFVGMSIFITSMILLYLASTIYHSVSEKSGLLIHFKKLDHLMIFVLIAGSYTPLCLNLLDPNRGIKFLTAVWSIAAAGMLLKIFWIHCPKWFSSVIYTGLGWICIFIARDLFTNLSLAGFLWLLVGGLFYTVGSIIYALKLPLFDSRHMNFGTHEIFHLFVMAGSLCHFIFMYRFIA